MSASYTLPWYRQLSVENWKVFAAAWIGWTLDGFDFVLITFVLTDIEKAFSINLTVAGTLILAAFATRWLGGAVIGSLADRVGRRNALILSILLFSGATFLCGLAWNYWSLLAFRLLVGLGMAGEYAAGTTFLMENWPETVRNKASGFLVSGWSAGGFLAAMVYPLIVPALGWRALFFVGILPAFFALYLRLKVSENEEFIVAKKTSIEPRVPSFLLLFTARWLPVTIALFVFMFSVLGMSWPLISLLPTYLKSIGYAPYVVGHVMAIANLGSMLGYISSGVIGDRIGTRRAVLTMLTIGLSFVLLTFAFAHSGVVVLTVLVFFVEFFCVGAGGLGPAYLAHNFSVNVRASGLGSVYNLGSLAGGLSPVWGAILSQYLGLGLAIGVLTIFWASICMIVIGFQLPKRAQLYGLSRIQQAG